MKNLSNEMLKELYVKNYTLKEIALLYNLNPSTIHRRINKLISIGELEQRARLRRNRATIYGKDDKVTINIREDGKIKRVITDDDIMTLIGFGFRESRISSITGLPIEMIKEIYSKYSKTVYENTSNINKWLVIELYSHRLNRLQIQAITGYTDIQISAILNQAIRAGFIDMTTQYVPTKQEKAIMDMYRNNVSINTIAYTNKINLESTKEIINRLIDIGLLETRNTTTRIINRKRINDGIEDFNILRLYNLNVSENNIADYYKVDKNSIIKAIRRLDRNCIKIYDKICELAIEYKQAPKQIATKLNIPVEIVYNHLKETVR